MFELFANVFPALEYFVRIYISDQILGDLSDVKYLLRVYMF